MARRDPHDGRGRLAAVLGPRSAGPAAVAVADPSVDDAPTLPLPAIAPRTRRRDRLADRWLPAAWRGARLDPGRPGALALLLTAAVAAVLAAVGVWWEAPRAERVPDLPALVDTTATKPSPAPTGPVPTTGPPEPLVVAVAGKVARPGLVRVAAGARVADVLAAAGGPLPGTDLAGVNLARRVSDGEQVAVGVAGAPDAGSTSTTGAGAAGSSGTPGTAAPLDLNAATVEQLDALPGVGPVLAQRIVDYRTAHGRFESVDQLREVDGIGDSKFAALRSKVTV
jgi:competence protein ComEA